MESSERPIRPSKGSSDLRSDKLGVDIRNIVDRPDMIIHIADDGNAQLLRRTKHITRIEEQEIRFNTLEELATISELSAQDWDMPNRRERVKIKLSRVGQAIKRGLPMATNEIYSIPSVRRLEQQPSVFKRVMKGVGIAALAGAAVFVAVSPGPEQINPRPKKNYFSPQAVKPVTNNQKPVLTEQDTAPQPLSPEFRAILTNPAEFEIMHQWMQAHPNQDPLPLLRLASAMQEKQSHSLN